MRVLLYAGGLDVSLPGGLETHLRELARALTARGHQVDLFAKPLSPSAPLRVTSEFEPDRYDVIHFHTGMRPGGLDPRHPYVRTLHFCVAAKMDTYVRIGRLKTLANPSNWRAVREERAAIRGPGRFIAVSRRVRDEFARFHGLNPGPVAVISNGVTPTPARIGRMAWRARHGIPDDTPVLLTIGRRDFVKGHNLLDQAWRLVRGTRPDAIWLRLGDDAPSREPGRWTTGPLPHEDVREWIEAADVGALPSYYEGCSVALLEMVGGGLYSLAHDVGNAPEVLQPEPVAGTSHDPTGPTGEIVRRDVEAWAAALARVLIPRRPRTPGLPAGYDWASIAAKTEAVYAEAIR